MKPVELLKNILLLVVSLALFLAAGEILTRLYQNITYRQWTGAGFGKIAKNRYLSCIDGKLGWRNQKNYRFASMERDYLGNQYLADIRTNEYGFRMFGDTASGRKKIMFIGDSFTNADSISGDYTYYGVIRCRLPVEVFACGGTGYGTLQEYMLLDEYFDLIRPDILVWQYASNDFINNDYQLELNSEAHNNRMRRPYMGPAGNIFYAIPVKNKILASMMEFSNRHSHFISSIFWRASVLVYRVKVRSGANKQSSERIIYRQGADYPGFKRSARTTARLMAMVRKRCGNITIITFSANDNDPYTKEFKKISEDNDMYFVPGVPNSLRFFKKKGINVTVDSAHWNELGHRVVAKKIIDYLEQHGLIR